MKKLWLLLLLVFLTGCGEAEPQPTCGPDGPPWILHNIYMNPQMITAGAHDRPVKAENFQALFDQTEGVLNSIRNYEGLVDCYRILFYLTGHIRREAQQFLRSLEFQTLGEAD